MMKLLRIYIGLAVIGIGITVSLANPHIAAAQSTSSALNTQTAGDFSIQVSPSPLVESVEPGEVSELQIKVRNAGIQAENLKIEVRSFKVGDNDDSVTLQESAPLDIAGWISFSDPEFNVGPGQTFTQNILIDVPADAGFSYSFALVISRQRDPNPVQGSRLIKGSLAVFTLLNVDRPGAQRKLEIVKLSASRRVYEYLPAELSLQFRNSGNTIAQPYGSIFMQRPGSTDAPLSTLAVNDKRGYILPGSTRTITASWKDGFPVRETSTAANGETSTRTKWNWQSLDKFRIGKYTAKVVAVYNDGTRDVPIEGSVSFWVIPWKILLGVGLVALLIVFSIGSLLWRVTRFGRRKLRRKTDE